jgi:hypothetical protein
MTGARSTDADADLNARGIGVREDVISGGSWISSDDQRPHFGLRNATMPAR